MPVRTRAAEKNPWKRGSSRVPCFVSSHLSEGVTRKPLRLDWCLHGTFCAVLCGALEERSAPPRGFQPGLLRTRRTAEHPFYAIHTNNTWHSCTSPLNASTSWFSADTVGDWKLKRWALGHWQSSSAWSTSPASQPEPSMTAHPPPSFQSNTRFTLHFAIRAMQGILLCPEGPEHRVP